MSRIVTISFTPLHAGGGVPKFNRDLHSAFPDRECVHYSWWDFPWYIEVENQPEWEKARTLNHYLVSSGKLRGDDVVVADGFWADGLQHLRKAISHSHGIWSHLTKDDVDAGKAPENPFHHGAQVAFRRRWTELGKRFTAVSDFIADQMAVQWRFKVDLVINNGVDTDEWRPNERDSVRITRPLIIHGVNDRSNLNKGWDHIEEVKDRVPEAEVLSLDEAGQKYPSNRPFILSQADIVVHPSGYEGNSMFIAEALSCGVPVIGYDVGYLYHLKKNGGLIDTGFILGQKDRSPVLTAVAVQAELSMMGAHPEIHTRKRKRAREVALGDLNIVKFRARWREYVQRIEEGIYD